MTRTEHLFREDPMFSSLVSGFLTSRRQSKVVNCLLNIDAPVKSWVMVILFRLQRFKEVSVKLLADQFNRELSDHP